jgi:hypothetical protein
VETRVYNGARCTSAPLAAQETRPSSTAEHSRQNGGAGSGLVVSGIVEGVEKRAGPGKRARLFTRGGVGTVAPWPSSSPASSPSGRLHFGNYFGAIRQHVALQDEPGEHFYFIADYHALTSTREPASCATNVREVALTYLALGLDPSARTLFRQSDVPEVCELAWLLCVRDRDGAARARALLQGQAREGARAQRRPVHVPVLMAADILGLRLDLVPSARTSSSTSRWRRTWRVVQPPLRRRASPSRAALPPRSASRRCPASTARR